MSLTTNIDSGLTETIGQASNLELKKLPSATTALFFFITLTLIYGFLSIYNINSAEDLYSVIKKSNNEIYTLIYVVFLVLGSFFINVNIARKTCNVKDYIIPWSKLATLTFLPWIVIFAIIFLILELFPGWVRPFSNTIGYLIANSLGATEILKKILKPSGTVEEQIDLKKALINIEKNYSRFINELDIDKSKYIELIQLLRKEEFMKTEIKQDLLKENGIENHPDVVGLFKLVHIKHVIGKLFWYVLAGSIIASISYNFVINLSCEKPVSTTAEEIDDLYAMNSDTKLYGKEWNLLNTEPDSYNSVDYTTNINIVKLIEAYSNRFETGRSTGEVFFTNVELRRIGLINELPKNTYIKVSSNYWKAVK